MNLDKAYLLRYGLVSLITLMVSSLSKNNNLSDGEEKNMSLFLARGMQKRQLPVRPPQRKPEKLCILYGRLLPQR